MTTIANAANVQSAGSLALPDSGGPTVAQIDAALQRAQTELLGLVDRETYIAVRDYAGADADELQKKEDFRDTEARFAMAHLPAVIRSAQLSNKGYVSETEVGKSITRYGDIRLSDKSEDDWRVEAMLILAEYIDLEMVDENDEQCGLMTGDGTMTLMAI